MNFLVLFGVASTAALDSGRGENTFENLLTLDDISLAKEDCCKALAGLDCELRGVLIWRLGSGLSVATETLLLG